MTAKLQDTVEQAYAIFGGYTIGRTLSVCHCNCCMSDETEHELVTTPLREVPARLLAEYTNSAHGWDDHQIAREMRHFLPRYLELIATNDPPDAMGLEICLRRLGLAGWRETWPAEEADILDCFFDALIKASVHRLELAHWPAGWRLDFDMADVLTLAVTAGGDIARVLRAWDATGDPPSVIHMAALRRDVLRQTDRTFFHSAHLEQHPDAADMIGAFLMRREVDARIEAAIMKVEDPRLQQILSDAV